MPTARQVSAPDPGPLRRYVGTIRWLPETRTVWAASPEAARAMMERVAQYGFLVPRPETINIEAGRHDRA
jgi:hypothetical protein